MFNIANRKVNRWITVIMIFAMLLLLYTNTSLAAGELNPRIQGDYLYWDIPTSTHSDFIVYANGGQLSKAHTLVGSKYQRYIGSFPAGTEFKVCMYLSVQYPFGCETVTSGTGGGDPQDPPTYTITVGLNDSILSWDVQPKAGAYQVSIKKDNQHVAYMGLSGQLDIKPFGSGAYKVVAEAMDGSVLGVSNMVNYTSSGGNPSQGNVQASINGSVLSWNIDPSMDYDRVRIYKDGTFILDTNRNNIDICEQGQGNYYVVPVDGRVSPPMIHTESNTVYFNGDCGGTTQPGDGGEDGENCGGFKCEQLLDLLTCPGWGLLMGDITEAISAALPPPPNWNYVASVMTGYIVPALTSDMLNYVVPTLANQIGNELDEHFGRATYNGDPNVDIPSFNQPWQPDGEIPQMRDLDQKIEFDLSDESQITKFEVEDMTETVTIPDPLGWSNPATEERPVPKFEADPRGTVPVGEVGELNPRQTNPSELGGNTDPQPRPTTPTSEKPTPKEPEQGGVTPKPTVPSDGGAAAPRPTNPSGEGGAGPRPTTPDDNGSQPAEPGTGDPKDTTPIDWKKGG